MYRARDREVGREVALKVILGNESLMTETALARLQREARILGSLRDPRTITLFDFGQTSDGLFYLVFEYVEGRDLAALVARNPHGLPEPRVRRILTQILQSLREAHRFEILHRDLKPANVLVYDYLDEVDCVKVIDFGIAKPITSDQRTVTQEGHLVGTVFYMAPEQLRTLQLTPATDIFCTGLIAWEMIMGRAALNEENRFEVWAHLMRGESLALPLEAEVSEDLRAIVDRMLRANPAERFGSAEEALAALNEASAPVPHPAAPPSRSPRPAAATVVEKERKLDPVSLAMIVGGVAVGCGLIIAVALSWSSEPPLPTPPVAPERPPPSAPVVATPPPVAVASALDLGGDSAAHDAGASDAATVVEDSAEPCVQPAAAGQSQHTHRMKDGRLRRWIAYHPKLENPKPLPVVLMFHSYGRTAAAMFEYTGFPELADREGLLVVAMDAEAAFLQWEGDYEKGHVREMLDVIEKDACIDRSKIYAFGHGKGAIFVEQLACDVPIAAVATTGRRAGTTCRNGRTYPLIHIEGIRNPAEPAKGGRGCSLKTRFQPVEPLDRVEARLARARKCGDSPAKRTLENGVCYEYECSNDPFVSCHTDGGRDWPGTPRRVDTVADTDCPGESADFPYRDTIWEFFQAQE